MDVPTQILAELINTEAITSTIFRHTYYAPEIASSALPGQFIMVHVGAGYDPLLRRPFSIHRVKEEYIQILFKVVGKGTLILSEKKAGEKADLIGPLGKGFKLVSGRKILVGGGLGIAPLLFLASIMQKQKETQGEVRVMLGACDRVEIEPFCQEFANTGAQVIIATDNGSLGHCGFVTELLLQDIEKDYPKKTQVYSCGPYPMMAKVASICKEAHLNCQVSLETMMACGLAACLGCAVPSAEKGNKYLHVCKDGPVFEAGKVIWNKA